MIREGALLPDKELVSYGHAHASEKNHAFRNVSIGKSLEDLVQQSLQTISAHLIGTLVFYISLQQSEMIRTIHRICLCHAEAKVPAMAECGASNALARGGGRGGARE